jgi:hypothetical protein
MNEDIQESNTIKQGYASKSPVWHYFKRVIINGVNRAQCLVDGCSKTLSMPN